jgi:hypothetical protein
LRRFLVIIFSVISLFSLQAQRNFLINGVITESDSNAIMPYVYVINARTGNGTISDHNGRFTVTGYNSDTLVFTFVGFLRKKVLVANIPSLSDSTKKFYKITMHQAMVNLNTISVAAFKIKPAERAYMERVIKAPKVQGIDYASSPITALYEQFSRAGRERRKLAAIFEQIFIEEQVSKKFNPEILRKLTGDDTIDFERFRKFSFELNDAFILTHDGYDLYEAIMKSYQRWLREYRGN